MEYLFNKQLTKNKSFELQINMFDDLSKDSIFCIDLNWRLKGDHAGLRSTLLIYCILYFHIIIYDHRHWDYDNDCFYNE